MPRIQYAFHDDDIRRLDSEWFPLRMAVTQVLRNKGFHLTDTLSDDAVRGMTCDFPDGLKVWRDVDNRCLIFQQELPQETTIP